MNDMKKDWEIKKLGDVLQKTETIDPTKNPEKEFVYVDVSSINNQNFTIENTTVLKGKDAPSRARKLIRNNDVIFATVRPTLKRISIISEELNEQVCSTGYFVLRGKENIDNKFLFYFLLTDAFNGKMETLQKGASYPAVTNSEVREQSIPIPPLTEQQYIVSILEEAFEYLEQARENVQRNLQNANELFQSELNSIFEKKGEGWVQNNLLEVCTLKSGTTISPELETQTGDTAYLKVADMNFAGNENRVNTSSRFVNKNEINENNIFPIGTIIFPKRGGAIATNKKRITDIPICADLNIMGAIANQSMYSEFLFYYFKKFNLLDIANGTTILQINNYSFEPMKISFPKSLEEQKKIVHQLDTLSTETKNLSTIYQQKLNALEELKKSILQKAFRGELKTKKMEVA